MCERISTVCGVTVLEHQKQSEIPCCSWLVSQYHTIVWHPFTFETSVRWIAYCTGRYHSLDVGHFRCAMPAVSFCAVRADLWVWGPGPVKSAPNVAGEPRDHWRAPAPAGKQIVSSKHPQRKVARQKVAGSHCQRPPAPVSG